MDMAKAANILIIILELLGFRVSIGERKYHQSRLATVLWMAGLTGMITVIALVIRWCKFGF